MAKVTTAKCDRCGRFCKDEEKFCVVTIVDEREYQNLLEGEAEREVDLCDECERGLLAFIDGAKLARPRKAKADDLPY